MYLPVGNGGTAPDDLAVVDVAGEFGAVPVLFVLRWKVPVPSCPGQSLEVTIRLPMTARIVFVMICKLTSDSGFAWVLSSHSHKEHYEQGCRDLHASCQWPLFPSEIHNEADFAFFPHCEEHPWTKDFAFIF